MTMSSFWQPVALSRDLPPLVVMPVSAFGRDIALWRSAQGRAAAWADRCPHRGMRLSHGFVRGEALSCIYHGWSYAESGACLRIPAHPDLTPPEAIRVPIFPLAEVGGLLWVGDPEAGEPPGPPPDPGALEPLRSLAVSAAGIAGLAQGLDGFWRGRIADVAVTAASNPRPDGGVTLHVLTEPAPVAARVQVSRWLERLRHEAEAA
jgi:nitrite reductase/ring-hydroxylating ferredoxin subunit